MGRDVTGSSKVSLRIPSLRAATFIFLITASRIGHSGPFVVLLGGVVEV